MVTDRDAQGVRKGLIGPAAGAPVADQLAGGCEFFHPLPGGDIEVAVRTECKSPGRWPLGPDEGHDDAREPLTARRIAIDPCSSSVGDVEAVPVGGHDDSPGLGEWPTGFPATPGAPIDRTCVPSGRKDLDPLEGRIRHVHRPIPSDGDPAGLPRSAWFPQQQ